MAPPRKTSARKHSKNSTVGRRASTKKAKSVDMKKQRPLTAYNVFFAKEMHEKSTNAAAIAKRWRALSTTKRAEFQRRADEINEERQTNALHVHWFLRGLKEQAKEKLGRKSSKKQTESTRSTEQTSTKPKEPVKSTDRTATDVVLERLVKEMQLNDFPQSHQDRFVSIITEMQRSRTVPAVSSEVGGRAYAMPQMLPDVLKLFEKQSPWFLEVLVDYVVAMRKLPYIWHYSPENNYLKFSLDADELTKYAGPEKVENYPISSFTTDTVRVALGDPSEWSCTKCSGPAPRPPRT